MAHDWIKFTTETGLIGGYRLVDGEYAMKLFSKVGKTHYYSCVNEIGDYFDTVIQPTL